MKLYIALLFALTLPAAPKIQLIDDSVASSSIHAGCALFGWPQKPPTNGSNVVLDLNATTFGFFNGGGGLATNGLGYTFTPLNVSSGTPLVFKRPRGTKGAIANPRFLLPAAQYNLQIHALDPAGNLTATESKVYQFVVPRCSPKGKGSTQKLDFNGGILEQP